MSADAELNKTFPNISKRAGGNKEQVELHIKVIWNTELEFFYQGLLLSPVLFRWHISNNMREVILRKPEGLCNITERIHVEGPPVGVLLVACTLENRARPYVWNAKRTKNIAYTSRHSTRNYYYG